MSKIVEDQLLEYSQNSFGEKYLQDCMSHVANMFGIVNPKYCVKFGTKKGDNYGSVVYRVYIEGKKNDTIFKISTIVKASPKDELIRLAIEIPHFFSREHYFYSEIVPIFKELLKSKNKSLENIGECYFSSIIDHEETICLDDLGAKGFVMKDRLKPLDFQHTSLAFRALGRLHALSFALRDQKPEIFKTKITTLKEPLFRPEFNQTPSMITRYKTVGKLIKMVLAEEDPKYLKRFSQYFKNTTSHTERSCDGNLAEPYAVLGHGDPTMNNMLFKYEKDSIDPEEIYILDFQFVRYASPAVDLSFILFCNCDQELRTNHFDDLIKIYYESLSTYLSEIGSDPEKLFPFEALLDQLDKFSLYSAGVGVLAIPGRTSRGNDVPEIGTEDVKLSELEERFDRDIFFQNTLRDSYKDLIDRNYI